MMVNAAKAVSKIYLDVCALSRPFDDQTQPRIRLETEALHLILNHVRQGHLQLMVSTVHEREIEAIEDLEEQNALEQLLSDWGHHPSVNVKLARQRAEAFVDKGLGIADAAHLAFSEQMQAEFISVDDRLLKRARRLDLLVWCGNPIEYCAKENLP